MQFRNGFRQKSVTFMYKRLPYTYVFLRIIYAKHIEKQTRNIKKKFKQIVTKTKKLRI